MDIWKRYSASVTINSTTLPSNANDLKKSSLFFDRHLLEQSVHCYRLENQLLLVEFNRSQILPSNSIYNLTIFDHQDHVIMTDHHYEDFSSNENFHSFIYRLKRRSLTYKIQYFFAINRYQSSETLTKYCDDFYPHYTPLTCSIKSSGIHDHHLMIYMQFYNNDKQISSLKPRSVFYRTSRTHLIKKNIYDINKVNHSIDH